MIDNRLLGIGRVMPRTARDRLHGVTLRMDTLASLKLLAFAREESLGQAMARTVRHALDALEVAYVASGQLSADCEGLPFDEWPVAEQIRAFVKPEFRDRIGPNGECTNLQTYGRRGQKITVIHAPLSRSEFTAAKLAAFNELMSLSRWTEECVRRELRTISGGLDLWTLPPQQQIEIVLAGEESAWEGALWTMETVGSRSVLSAWAPRPPADTELLLEVTQSEELSADDLLALERRRLSSLRRANSGRGKR